MRSLFTRICLVRFSLAALVLALEVLASPHASFAQSQPAAAPVATPAATSCPGSVGPPDYPVSGGPTHGGGWFYTQEACRWPSIIGSGPARARGYTVLDDDKGNFWTEFRRFGGVDVLGYPVSQPYQAVGTSSGYWYQAFERGILQYQPETGRAVLANVFEQFTAAGLDPELAFFGIPGPQSVDPAGQSETDQRMSWLTDPRFLARYLFDPVASHSSDPGAAGQAAYAFQEQAWPFFGLPQGVASRLILRTQGSPAMPGTPAIPGTPAVAAIPATASSPATLGSAAIPGTPAGPPSAATSPVELWPLLHAFMVQRFQKAGMELFMEDLPPTAEQFDVAPGATDNGGQILDPTIVPGDGKKGCVALTAVGLLARTIGIDKIIPRTMIQPIPLDPTPTAFFTTWIPPTTVGQAMVQFQVDGTTFAPSEPITIALSDGIAPVVAGQLARILPLVPPSHVEQANTDGSFTKVISARVGTYTVTATGDRSARSFVALVDLTVPTLNINLNGTSTCQPVGLPVGN